MLANIIRNAKKATSSGAVSLLLHMDGTDGSTSIVDSGPNALTVTRVGTPTISTAQSQFGGASLNLPGSSYLTVPNSAVSGLNATNWTIETWIYMSAIPSIASIVGCSNGSGGVPKFFMNLNMSTSFVAQSNRVGFHLYNGGDRWINAAYTWATNTWYHIAAVQNGSSVTLYVNGQSVGSMAFTIASGITGNFRIGTDGETYKILVGRMDELRVTKGLARYTTNFTPPTAAFPDL
ncbi:Concanavalin A-like lectin/glucanases superfamily [uncultured Caudovirales phage]|uniref:Concanavalin A-like lectin/glucanases superfamily n=1 Tax=uncultured Caudovirales phage TaxID=2100421 RepID=A0A6J5ML43_9CAUD|nr:Concanavalin A-like lectin/glucanases superfamily [uncultured Caudovirales phage]